ncbi:restriction endonuclease subunit S [Escherichia coli]|uniref:restriction endonuclease subunit S n=2 Tax=Escherichia coli TaxID=562 RepID=UPI00168F4677|nr:restriction endonuclease subunit S [Escherichia coli]EFH5381450.1 restriction endonuclease subunit S [Escherichia coli]EFJ4472084.1 restriction endonuclease subunit S [Escherichia coli]EFM2198939.1 restriction endonuclease subunit S [Escherichia coli]EFO2495790.1 restriction endonuclease subunit S [Escherichia coli]EFO2756485.1 restriction endonuclease subunit S [Escherichia coli]
MVPKGWTLGTLKDLADTIMGYAFRSEDFVPTGIPLLRMGNLYQNTLDLNRNPVYLPDSFKVDYKRFLVSPGDLVMSMTGTMGKRDYGFTVEIPSNTQCSLLNQRVLKIVPKNNASSGYILNLLRSELILSVLYSFPGGTKQANLSAKQLQELPVLIPPELEQKKIAQILSTWDKAISVTEKLLTNSQQQKKALMQQLLTGKKRLGLPAGSYEFKITRYGSIPKDWDYPAIKEICTQVSEKNSAAVDHPVLSCSKYDGFVDSLKYFNKKVYSDDLSGYRLIHRGCFGFPSNHIEEGSIGLQNLYDTGIVSPIYVVFRASPTKVDNSYLYAVLKTDHYKQIFGAATNASVDRRGSLRWKEFNQIHVPLPPLKEQQKISAVLSAADAEITTLEKKLACLKDEKKALMQQLLTGKRRVKVDEAVAE